MDSNRKQFLQCFVPVFIPLFATGCLSFRLNAEHQFQANRFIKLYTNLARFTTLGIFITGFVLKVRSHQYSQHLKELSPLIKFLGFTELLVSMATYMEVSVILELKRNAHIELYERAYELDNCLAKEFAVNFNYPKTARKNRMYVTLLTLYCGTYYIFYIVNLDPDWRLAMIGLGYSLCTIGPGVSSYGHISSMDYLRIRFRLFQKMLRKYFRLSPKEEEAQRGSILSLMNYYRKYCELVQGVNNIYGHVAISTAFHDFSQASSMVFVLCHKASESRAPFKEYVLLFMFVVPRLIKVVYTAVYSRSTMAECKVCAQIIGTYDDIYPQTEIKENINSFLLWKKHNYLRFTVGKVLVSNFGLVYSFFLGIGNYVLILIQLKLQEASIEERLREKFAVEKLPPIK